MRGASSRSIRKTPEGHQAAEERSSRRIGTTRTKLDLSDAGLLADLAKRGGKGVDKLVLDDGYDRKAKLKR